MSSARLAIGRSRIGVQVGGARRALMSLAWSTRHGLLLCEDGDKIPDAQDCPEIVGALPLHDDASWEPTERAPQAAALEHASLPRAVRWAVALRALAELTGGEIESVEIDVAGLGDASAAREAARAITLLGWSCESITGVIATELALLSRWRQRKPWCDLRLVEGNRPVISGSSPLPARARFGRMFIDVDAKTEVSVPQLLLGDESLTAIPPLDCALPGAQEYEVCWKLDGGLALDLLVDDAWRPWPAALSIVPTAAANLEAAMLYAALDYWSQALAAIDAAVLDVVATATTVNA